MRNLLKCQVYYLLCLKAKERKFYVDITNPPNVICFYDCELGFAFEKGTVSILPRQRILTKRLQK